MRRIFTYAAVFAVLFTLTACSNQELTDHETVDSSSVNSSESIEDTANDIAESSSSPKISITLPEGWSSVDGSSLDVQYMKNSASFILKKESFSGKDLKSVDDEMMQIYTDSFEDVKIVSGPDRIEIDGKEAHKIVCTASISGYDMKYEFVSFFVGKDNYVVTFGDLASSFDSLADDYDTILQGIHFDNESA